MVTPEVACRFWNHREMSSGTSLPVFNEVISCLQLIISWVLGLVRQYISPHPNFCVFHLELRPLTAFQKPASPSFLPFPLTLHPESAWGLCQDWAESETWFCALGMQTSPAALGEQVGSHCPHLCPTPLPHLVSLYSLGSVPCSFLVLGPQKMEDASGRGAEKMGQMKQHMSS